MSDHSDRKELRKSAMSVRDELDADSRETDSIKISEHILDHPKTRKANYIFTYLSYRSEVDTWILAEELLNMGKKVCAPLINGPGSMEARQVLNLDDDIEIGPMGISAPVALTERIDPRLIDLVLAPGLLFDQTGMRLGYGGGYYDRYLQGVRPHAEIWGLAFREQLSKSDLESNSWDKRMTGLVTPNGFIKTSI